ncbi:MAG: TonB-dependent receptor [Draconibacterium sp.]|nr:TonB-dependent receptor [Draconibacterium sp.]
MGDNNNDEMWHGMENSTKNETPQVSERMLEVENSIDEFSAELIHNYSLLNGVQVDVGLGYEMNNVWLDKRATGENQINLSNQLNNGYLFAQGSLPISKNLLVKPGVRVIYAGLTGEYYVEPKLSASFSVSEPLKINASFGQYHQFISKTSFVDSNLNTTLYWTASDGAVTPVLGATHYVSGVSYNKNNFLLSVEGYFKQTTGITRYYSGTPQVSRGFYSGKGRSFGIDFYLKKEYKKNVAWIAYTISKTEENLSFDNTNQYRLAPQHQKHELKLAGIYNLKAFYFSANYVYGSGFEIMKNYTGEGGSVPIYSRLDVAAIYKFSKHRLFGKIGISVLNVLNQQNIKYTNLRRVENGDTELINIHSEAVPFTPTLFLTFSF